MTFCLRAAAMAAALVCNMVFAAEKPLRDPEMELLKQPAQKMLANAKLAASADDVGDADSFGRYVKWLGVKQTPMITVSADCTPGDALCLAPSAPGTVLTFDKKALVSITLPPESSSSLICHQLSPFWWYSLDNTGTNNSFGLLQLTPYVTVYNEVLYDPSAVDPNTGIAYGGKLEYSLSAQMNRYHELRPGETVTMNETYSRQCIGGLVSKQQLMNVWGLSENLASKFFKHKTVIEFHLRGRHSGLASASFFYGVRLTGD